MTYVVIFIMTVLIKLKDSLEIEKYILGPEHNF